MTVFLARVACSIKSTCVKSTGNEATDVKVAKGVDIGGPWVGGTRIEISYARDRNLMLGDGCVCGLAHK